MNADTFVLPSGPPRIGPLPSPGTYRATPDRCILEVSRRLDPLAVRRRRCTTRSSSLVIAADSPDPRLTVEAEERGGGALEFTATEFKPTNSGGFDISGELSLRDTTIPLTLRTRVVDREDDRLLIIGTGHAHRVRLLLAADFR
ncbi:MAG TPA: hypothetical protein VL551_24230 [Actinospica sp.]|jgi:hypothetical protein|nr:hypothetical protein [Actinospica sp.]